MAIFNTDTASFAEISISGSASNRLNVIGSGSAIFRLSGSTGGLLEVGDIGTSGDVFTISSGSINILNIKNTLSVTISGSLLVSGSISGSFPTNIRTHRFELGVSSTTAITTGAKGRKAVSYAGTIVGFRLVADVNTTTVVDIWKANLAIPTVANTITGTAKPTLTNAQLVGSTTLTGWTTSVADGDVFIINVDSNNNANYFSLELEILLNNS